MLPSGLERLRSKPLLRVSQGLDRCPGLRKRLHQLLHLIWRFRVKRRYAKIRTSNPDRLYWVNPDRIVYAHTRRFSKFQDKGKAIGGDWDLPENRKAIEDLDVYQAFCQRFLNHKSWQETQYYHRVLGQILDGRNKWDCTSREQLDDRCKEADELYQDIADNGYKTQRELNANSRVLFEEEDEITVSIARTGELLSTDGRHRSSITKILGLKEVPVKITVRHPGWLEFRREILAQAEGDKEKKVYQPLIHPDLADIPSVHGHDRFDIIRQNLSIRTGTLLDIGANWGYFCHRFEDEGFDCYAVENSHSDVYFLNKLRGAEDRKFKVFCGSIFDFRERNVFDVVLALNIFHHFLKDESSYVKLIELLGRLEMRELFFGTATYGSRQMQNAYKHYSPDDFVAFILEHSCLKEAKHIGESEDGRGLYKLYQ